MSTVSPRDRERLAQLAVRDGLRFGEFLKLLGLSMTDYVQRHPNYYAAEEPPIPGLQRELTTMDGVLWKLKNWTSFAAWCSENGADGEAVASLKLVLTELELDKKSS